MHHRGFYEIYIKRFLDVIFSAAALLLLSPVLLIVAILVRVKLGSPIIFRQERPGRIDPKTGQEKIFIMYKFRTMTNQRDADGNLLSDKLRLTKFGSFLRKTSLDELPELYNILKGDMSFVGPRPLLVSYLPLYNQQQRRRHMVSPGLTGYAQTHGRNGITWEEKFRYDVWYVDHVSFLLDVKIIGQTILTVFKREGINSETSVTMEPFTGNDNQSHHVSRF